MPFSPIRRPRGRPRARAWSALALSGLALFFAAASLGGCADTLARLGWMGFGAARDEARATGLPESFWPALPFAMKTFVFSSSGDAIDIRYLNLAFRDGVCPPSPSSISLDGGSLPAISQPLTSVASAAIGASAAALASAASAAAAASGAAAPMAYASVPQARSADGSVGFKLSGSKEKPTLSVLAERSAGVASWRFERALSPGDLLVGGQPRAIFLGSLRSSGVVVADFFGPIEALDRLKTAGARSFLRRHGVEVPDPVLPPGRFPPPG
jgi:hypothetical protein